MAVDTLQFGRKLGFGCNAVVLQLFAHRLQDVEYDLVDEGRLSFLINSPEQGADSVEYFADAMAVTQHLIQNCPRPVDVERHPFEKL